VVIVRQTATIFNVTKNFDFVGCVNLGGDGGGQTVANKIFDESISHQAAIFHKI